MKRRFARFLHTIARNWYYAIGLNYVLGINPTRPCNAIVRFANKLHGGIVCPDTNGTYGGAHYAGPAASIMELYNDHYNDCDHSDPMVDYLEEIRGEHLHGN